MGASSLGYGEGCQRKYTFRNNDATGGNNILKGNAVSLVLTTFGTAPNTGGPHPLVTRSGAADINCIGVALENMDKGPGAATAEGQFGEICTWGFCQGLCINGVAAGEAVGPDASGVFDDNVAPAGQFACALEGNASGATRLTQMFFGDRGQLGFGGA